jgi:putative transposase
VIEIRRVHIDCRQAYGTLKVWKELKERGINCGKNRVARLRQLHGIETRRRRRFKVTTKARKLQEIAPNIVNRCFKAEEPNRVWFGDVTFIATRTGWLYLAVMLDLYSRKVIGWSMSEQNNKELVINALDMAIVARKPTASVIHHTDQGSIYASEEYMGKLRSNNMIQSMSRKGDCYDNAVAESFFSTLKNELVLGNVYKSREEARGEIFNYIEIFYNRKRIHQSLGYKTPKMVEESVAQLTRPLNRG